MPKRKRESHDQGTDPSRTSNLRKQSILGQYTQSKKLLHRALKTAKGFERQKLGKRLRLAKAESKISEITRINREIEALKGLDLGKVTDGHLNKGLLKVKAFAESENLPAEVRVEGEKPAGSEEEVAALRNVVSGMCNTKQVKEVMEEVMGGMHVAFGIPRLVNGAKKGDINKKLKNGAEVKAVKVVIAEPLVEEEGSQDSKRDEVTQDLEWEGFDSAADEDIYMQGADDAEDESGSDIEEYEEEDIKYDSLDEEDITRYEALLGGSSDEESFDEEKYAKIRLSNRQNTGRQSLSLSPSPTASPRAANDPEPEISLGSGSDSESDPELEPVPKSKPKTAKSKKVAPLPTPKGSTFLPTLMGGYWSGTDSSASDLEDSVAPIRKNRPGQSARRAIWEKKYGTGANHIKSGQGSVAERGKGGKDDGWDGKRGAKGDRGGAGSRSGGRGRGRGRDASHITGENARAVASRGRGVPGKKDDAGTLHPSWQAAKKAKESEKTAKFEGKKVTFD